jgi:hypothetical protein
MSTNEQRRKRREYMRHYRVTNRLRFVAEREKKAALRPPYDTTKRRGSWTVSEWHDAAAGLPICVVAHRIGEDVISKLMQRATALGQRIRDVVACGQLKRETKWLVSLPLSERTAKILATVRRRTIIEWCGGRSPLLSDQPSGWKQRPDRRRRHAPSTARRAVMGPNGTVYPSLRAAAAATGVGVMTILRNVRAGTAGWVAVAAYRAL